MKQTINKQAPSIDQFYEFCWSNNKLTEEDVDKILIRGPRWMVENTQMKAWQS